jgi:two-component system cell cycle sensor histidine kinase/response regulator CckA
MASAAAPECVHSARPAARDLQTILVVEDETFVCEVTCDLLRHSGYRVLHAENAADARRIFSRHFDEIDLLLCDAILPDENGLSLAHCLRQRSPRLKVIVASGYPRSELDRKIDIDACTQFLTKPFTSATLISRIRMLLTEQCASLQTQSRGR